MAFHYTPFVRRVSRLFRRNILRDLGLLLDGETFLGLRPDASAGVRSLHTSVRLFSRFSQAKLPDSSLLLVDVGRWMVHFRGDC